MAEHAMFLSALYNPAMRPRPQPVQAPTPIQAAAKPPADTTPPAPPLPSRSITTAASSSPRPREVLVVRKQASLTSMKHGVRVLPHTHGRNNSNTPIGPSPLNPTPQTSPPRKREQQQQQGLTIAEIEHLRKLPPPPFPARNSSKTYSDRLSRRMEKVIKAISSNAPPPPGGWEKVLDELNGVDNTRIKKTGDYLAEAIAASAAAQAKAERAKEKERKRSRRKKEKLEEEMEEEETGKANERGSKSSSFQGGGSSSGRLSEHHPVEDDEDPDWQDIINDYAEEDDTFGSLPSSSLHPPKSTRGIRKIQSQNRILWEDITRIAQDLQQKLGPGDGLEEIEEEVEGDYYDDVSSQMSSRFEPRVPSWRVDHEKESGDGLSAGTGMIRVQSNTSLISRHSRRSSSASATSDSSRPRGPRQLPSFERSPLTTEAVPAVTEPAVTLPDIKVEEAAAPVVKDEAGAVVKEEPPAEVPEVEVKRVRTAKISVEVSPPPSPEVVVAPPLPESKVEDAVSSKPISPVPSPKPENAIPPPPPPPPPSESAKLAPSEQSNERRASFGETMILALPTGIIRVRKQKSRAALARPSTPPKAETSPVVATSSVAATGSSSAKRFNPISRMFKRLAMPADKPDDAKEAAKDVPSSGEHSAAVYTSAGDSSSNSSAIPATPQSAATTSTLMFTPQTSFPEHALPALPDVAAVPDAAAFPTRPVVDTTAKQMKSVEAAEMSPTPTVETVTSGSAPLATSTPTEAPAVPSKRDTPEYEGKFTKEVLADAFRRGFDKIDRSETVKTTATADFENTGFGTDDGGDWFTGPLGSSKLADSSDLGSSRQLADSSYLDGSKALTDQEKFTTPLGSSEMLADSVDLDSLRRMLATIARPAAKAPGEAMDDPLAVDMSRTSSDGSEIVVIDDSNEELDVPIEITEAAVVFVAAESIEGEATVMSTVDTVETAVEAETDVKAVDDEQTLAEPSVSKAIVEESVLTVGEPKVPVEATEVTMEEPPASELKETDLSSNITLEGLPVTEISLDTTEVKAVEVPEVAVVISSVVTQLEVEILPEPSLTADDVAEVAKHIADEPHLVKEVKEEEKAEKGEVVVLKQLSSEETLVSDSAPPTDAVNVTQKSSETESGPALNSLPTTDASNTAKTTSELAEAIVAPEKVTITAPPEPTEASTPTDRKGKKVVTFDEVDISTLKPKLEEEEEDEDDESDDEEEVFLKPALPSSRRSLPSPGTPRSPQGFSRGDEEDPKQWAMRVDEKMRVSSSVIKDEPKTVIGNILKTTQFWGGLR
ncbi:hypothetical protein BJ742DRAFT_776320 [Cladochytrium replicatum]|nr:hypothetical protein BJ742DRAFT_776320 [Cladochytrium replicatum]